MKDKGAKTKSRERNKRERGIKQNKMPANSKRDETQKGSKVKHRDPSTRITKRRFEASSCDVAKRKI